VTENAEADIEYTLLDGRKERISAAQITYVSVLSDRRGIVYTRAGRVIVVTDGLTVLERWREVTA
jgi:hypothetical protein